MESAFATASCLACLILARQEAAAVPASPAPVTVQQPGGQSIQIYLRGDEFLHWNEDAAGFTILKDDQTGRWVYAVPNASGSLVPSTLVVGRDNPRLLNVPTHLRSAEAKAQSQAARAATLGAAAPKGGPALAPTNGTVKNLVVLVEFKNLKHTHEYGEFIDLFNHLGYVTDGAHGSVLDYYGEVSHHVLGVQSIVTDWVTLTNNWEYYGRDNGFPGQDEHTTQSLVLTTHS